MFLVTGESVHKIMRVTHYVNKAILNNYTIYNLMEWMTRYIMRISFLHTWPAIFYFRQAKSSHSREEQPGARPGGCLHACLSWAKCWENWSHETLLKQRKRRRYFAHFIKKCRCSRSHPHCVPFSKERNGSLHTFPAFRFINLLKMTTIFPNFSVTYEWTHFSFLCILPVISFRLQGAETISYF